MGRQIAIAASAADERAFLAWLRETTEIQLLRGHVLSRRELWVDRVPPFSSGDTRFYVWNKRYAWKPKVCKTCDGSSFYVETTDHGPVIVFDRTDVKRLLVNPINATGNIYWAGYNRQKGFVTWFNGILRWVYNNGCPLKVYSSKVYCLPDLWQQLQARHPGVTAWDGQWRVAAPDAGTRESVSTVQRRRSLARTWEHLESLGETMPRDSRGRPFVPPAMPNYEDDEPGFSFFRWGIEDADYSQLTLPRTFFGLSGLERVSFHNTDLSGSRMCWNDFIECDFSRANLSGCDLRASVFRDCSFDGATLTEADLRHSTFEGCTFKRARLRGAIADRKYTAAVGMLDQLTARQRESTVWRKTPGRAVGRRASCEQT